MGIFVKENDVVLEHLTLPQLLKLFPNSVYTVMRTVDNYRYIFKYTEHVKNLHNYLKNTPKIKSDLIINEETEKTEKERSNDDRDGAPIFNDSCNIELIDLFQLCSEYIIKGFSFLNNLSDDVKKEHFNDNPNYSVILILKWKEEIEKEKHENQLPLHRQVMILCYIKSLDIHPKYVDVEMRYAKREEPNVKSTEIYKLREHLKLKKNEVNEIILYNDKNEITEGLSSNFFCFFNNFLYAADDKSVLKGTMRKTILDICARENIPVEKKNIEIVNIEHFDFCFIASTSRNICPIKKVTLFSSEGTKEIESKVNHSVLQILQQKLLEEIDRLKEDYAQYVTS